MKNSRRQFLKVAGLSFLGLASGPFPGKLLAAPGQGEYKVPEKELMAKQWGMVIDTRKFTRPEDFQAVSKACHTYHNVPSINSNQDVKWIWTEDYRGAFTDQVDRYPATAVLERNYLLLCNHCENPACVRVCPTKATFKREDGIVVMDYHRCIGCRYCMAGCPFGARSFNFMDPRPHIAEVNPTFPTRMRGVVEKCTFCSELLAEGKMPLCVEAAPEGGITFGDLADPESDVRKVLAENFTIRRKPTLGTEPSVFYIL